MNIKTDNPDVLALQEQCDEKFISNFIQQCKARTVYNKKWASEAVLEFVPFFLLGCQVRPGKMLPEEPTNKKNVVCYSFSDLGSLMLIEQHGAHGTVNWLSYIHKDICIKVDDYGDLLSFSKLFKDKSGRIEKSITIDENDYFVKRYIYEQNRVTAIESTASNSGDVPVMLTVHYNDGVAHNLSYQWKNKTMFLVEDL